MQHSNNPTINNHLKKYTESEDSYQQFCEKLVPVTIIPDSESSAGPRRVRVPKPDGTFELKLVEEESLYKRPLVADQSKFDKAVAKFYRRIEKLPEQKAGMNALSNLLKENFNIGENHNQIQAKKFLIENMKSLKESGYEFLFLEHLFYDHQADLDDYFTTGEMSDRLRIRLRTLDAEMGTLANRALWEKYNFTNLVIAAKEAGIRVVAIDVEGSYATQAKMMMEDTGDNRVAAGNYTFANIMEREVKKLGKDKKWCSLIGVRHCRLYKEMDNRMIPGVCDMTGAKAVFILDNESQEITLNKQYTPPGKRPVTIIADVFIQVPENTSLKLDDLQKQKINVTSDTKKEGELKIENHNNTYSEIYQMAERYQNANNVDKRNECKEKLKAYAKDPTNLEAQFQLAKYYDMMSKTGCKTIERETFEHNRDSWIKSAAKKGHPEARKQLDLIKSKNASVLQQHSSLKNTQEQQSTDKQHSTRESTDKHTDKLTTSKIQSPRQ